MKIALLVIGVSTPCGYGVFFIMSGEFLDDSNHRLTMDRGEITTPKGV